MCRNSGLCSEIRHLIGEFDWQIVKYITIYTTFTQPLEVKIENVLFPSPKYKNIKHCQNICYRSRHVCWRQSASSLNSKSKHCTSRFKLLCFYATPCRGGGLQPPRPPPPPSCSTDTTSYPQILSYFLVRSFKIVDIRFVHSYTRELHTTSRTVRFCSKPLFAANLRDN